MSKKTLYALDDLAKYGRANTFAIKPVDEDLRIPFEIVKTYDKKQWKLDKKSYSGTEYPNVDRLAFDTKEMAADFVFNLCQAIKLSTEATPLPDDIMNYIERQSHDLRTHATHLSGEIFSVRMRQRSIAYLAKKFGIKEAAYNTKESDIDAAIETLMTFCREGDETPFFSEATLYPLIGKEDARTVLAVLSKITELLKPGSGHEL